MATGRETEIPTCTPGSCLPAHVIQSPNPSASVPSLQAGGEKRTHLARWQWGVSEKTQARGGEGAEDTGNAALLLICKEH
jgi:hypothetical protein